MYVFLPLEPLIENIINFISLSLLSLVSQSYLPG